MDAKALESLIKAITDLIKNLLSAWGLIELGKATEAGKAKDDQLEQVEQAKRIEAHVDGLSPDDLDGLRRTIERGYKVPAGEKTDSTGDV